MSFEALSPGAWNIVCILVHCTTIVGAYLDNVLSEPHDYLSHRCLASYNSLRFDRQRGANGQLGQVSLQGLLHRNVRAVTHDMEVHYEKSGTN